jgi:hypothetical protein
MKEDAALGVAVATVANCRRMATPNGRRHHSERRRKILDDLDSTVS